MSGRAAVRTPANSADELDMTVHAFLTSALQSLMSLRHDTSSWRDLVPTAHRRALMLPGVEIEAMLALVVHAREIAGAPSLQPLLQHLPY